MSSDRITPADIKLLKDLGAYESPDPITDTLILMIDNSEPLLTRCTELATASLNSELAQLPNIDVDIASYLKTYIVTHIEAISIVASVMVGFNPRMSVPFRDLTKALLNTAINQVTWLVVARHYRTKAEELLAYRGDKLTKLQANAAKAIDKSLDLPHEEER